MERSLTLACWDYDRTLALADGRVRPLGIELTYLNLPIEETFFRMARFKEFDVAEMSLSSYLVSLERGHPFVAIPVFPSRSFRHNGVYVHAQSGIEKPRDLTGKIVGLPEYQLTACVWIRGILADHEELPVDAVRYRTGGLHRPGRVEKIPVTPAGIDIEAIPTDRTLDEMLTTGEIDAIYTPRVPSPYTAGDRSVRRLWPNAQEAEIAYYRNTGIFPIMHTVVIRREVYDANPWIANSLYQAFCDAKELAEERLEETAASPSMLPWGYVEAERARLLLGDGYWSYGLERNEHVLGTFIRYALEQGLINHSVEPAELFVPETAESYVI